MVIVYYNKALILIYYIVISSIRKPIDINYLIFYFNKYKILNIYKYLNQIIYNIYNNISTIQYVHTSY
jgi:DNA polymerase III delta prime subunit